MKVTHRLVALFALIILAGGFFLLAKPFTQSSDNDIIVLPRDSKELTREEALPEGRKLFVDPDGKFSFQYESNGNDYVVEPIYKINEDSSDLFAMCDALNCYFV